MLVIDTEVYKDYFLFAAKNILTGKTLLYDMHPGKALDVVAIKRLMRHHTTISFNGFGYDLPILVKAVTGSTCEQLKRLSDKIIKSGFPAWKICKDEDITIPQVWDHIDLIEVAPGRSSLKIYGGRMHAPKLQDLPIKPDYCVPKHLYPLLRSYCVNDLETTELLYFRLKPAIDLRDEMSEQYGMDLRSKSDAQIAETVIKSELNKLTGKDYKAPKLESDYGFYYQSPGIIEFQTPELKAIFARLLKERFTLGPSGSVLMPVWLKQEKITIGCAHYQMGIGGLHSCESSQYIKCKPDEVLSDWDVASYYPSIILQQQLAPKSLGFPFLKVYQQIVTRRIKAKKSGDKVTADTLKIAVNGSFGKLGSKYSALYAPDLLIQTTVTGQLALLMLIERLHIAGITVASANTDGIVIHHKKADQRAVDAIMWDWMLDTTYSLERTDYMAIASRDVNNYVAVKLNGETKGKGVFAKPGLQKNPDRLVVYEAVAKLIAEQTPIEKTIADCKDITKFCTVRAVKGGAVWQGEELGKAVRFYYSTSAASDECIHYAINNNRVPNSAGAMPLMDLPDSFPNDVDYEAYLVAAEKLLCEVGYRHA
jgi:hypothetical protein